MSLVMDDLRNRRVVRVAIAYLLAATAVLISVGVVEAWIGLPDWTLRLVAGAAFVIMPFVLVLTWALTNQGPENARTRRR